mgnify:CR=1 FL=1
MRLARLLLRNRRAELRRRAELPRGYCMRGHLVLQWAETRSPAIGAVCWRIDIRLLNQKGSGGHCWRSVGSSAGLC